MNRLFIILVMPILCVGCAHQVVEPPLTQLQIRSIQSREFDSTDKKIVMKAVMNVLQDEGFIVKNAVFELGLLNAEKFLDVENKGVAILSRLACGEHARWNKHSVLEASANIDEFGDRIRVRMNFQTKTYDNMGCVSEIVSIQNEKYYQDFFSKVSKALFIQSEDL
jgi:hypothetical protein